jgi:two-component system, response regulator PdtaR
MKVLILEDDAEIAGLLADQLAEAGHTVCGAAETVAGAFAVIARGNMPEVALVDIRLRHGSPGTEFAKDAKQRFDLPCIFVSSEASDAFLHRHLAVGYISKPWRAATVLDSLEVVRALKAGQQPAQVPDGLYLFV